jgi:hypothetical protein
MASPWVLHEHGAGRSAGGEYKMRIVSSRVALFTAVLLGFAPAAARAAAPAGAYVLLGAGATQFTDSSLRDAYDTGFTWNARAGLGLRSFIGVEGAYVGARRNASVGSQDITQNGVEGVVRLQYPYAMQNVLVEPFVLGGIGWSHFKVDNVPAGAKSTDDIGTVPVGAGVTLGFGRFLVDARFDYRFTFNEDIGNGNLKNWDVVGSIGYEF